MTNKLTMLI